MSSKSKGLQLPASTTRIYFSNTCLARANMNTQLVREWLAPYSKASLTTLKDVLRVQMIAHPLLLYSFVEHPLPKLYRSRTGEWFGTMVS
eukprot:6334240-Amphidinium_carterae.1